MSGFEIRRGQTMDREDDLLPIEFVGVADGDGNRFWIDLRLAPPDPSTGAAQFN